MGQEERTYLKGRVRDGEGEEELEEQKVTEKQEKGEG